MGRRAATRADVAKRAGVSESTVSYVLSRVRPVSDATRARVQQAMADLDYTPNALARGLAGARSGVLALHYPMDARGFQLGDVEYMSYAAAEAAKRGYRLMLWVSPLDNLDELRLLAGQGFVDGVLLAEVLLQDPRPAALDAVGLKYALIGRTATDDTGPAVDADVAAGATLTIEHLASLGHRSVSLMSMPTAVLGRGYGLAVRTEEEMLRAANQRGMPLHTVHSEATVRAGWQALEQMMSETPDTTAVVTINEMAAIGLIQAAVAHGHRVPDDLSVIALNISPSSAGEMVPALTDVTAPVNDVVRGALELLIGHLQQSQAAFQSPRLVTPVLTVRESTGRPTMPR